MRFAPCTATLLVANEPVGRPCSGGFHLYAIVSWPVQRGGKALPLSRVMGTATVNSLEHALRKALEKGDANDPAFRKRVYDAAATAMQRSLEARGEATPERLKEQSERLGEAVRAVETGYRTDPVQPPALEPQPEPGAPEMHAPAEPALQGEAVQPPRAPRTGREEPVVAPPPVMAPDESRSDPPMHAPDVAPDAFPGASTPDLPAGEGQVYVEPRLDARRHQAEALSAEITSPARRSPFRFDRGPFATVFAVVVAAALVFGGLWWVLTSGAFLTQEARDTAVRNPPLQLEEEGFSGRDSGTAAAPQLAADAGEDGDWIRLFEPSDPTVLQLEGGATATIETDPFGDYARLVTPGDESRVYVDVPVGALRSLVGQRVQISLLARSEEGAPTQMSVTCDFGPLGDCGRHRFNVDQAEAEYLFHVDLPDAAAPREPGLLILQADIEAGDRAVNLMSARLRAAVE